MRLESFQPNGPSDPGALTDTARVSAPPPDGAEAGPVPFVDLGVYHASIRDRLLERIAAVIDSSAFILGDEVARFEERFAEYCGTRHAVGVGSGTEALTLALAALDLQPGDEVITAANTFVATVEAIVHAGGTPVLADADPATRNIDVARIEERITARTRAIVPVHLFGRPAEMTEICELARRRGLRVVEDAAQAHGARYRGAPVGSLGDAACFSFYPAKNLGALGDAGAVVTNDDAIAHRVRELRDHGGTAKYEHLRVGTTSRLDTIQAAALNVKLDDLDERNARRREVARWYAEAFAGDRSPILPETFNPSLEQVFHLYVVRVPAELRDGLADHLRSHGVASGVHYPRPVHRLEAFAHLGYGAGAFPVAERLASEILSLPMYPELAAGQVARVARLTREYLARVAVAGEAPR